MNNGGLRFRRNASKGYTPGRPTGLSNNPLGPRQRTRPNIGNQQMI